MTPLTPAARTPKPEELPVHSARGRGRVGRGLCPQETFRFRGEEDRKQRPGRRGQTRGRCTVCVEVWRASTENFLGQKDVSA